MKAWLCGRGCGCATGLNNDQHKKAWTPLSILYSDLSVLEQHHCAVTTGLMLDKDISLLKGLAPRAQVRPTQSPTRCQSVPSPARPLHPKRCGWCGRRGHLTVRPPEASSLCRCPKTDALQAQVLKCVRVCAVPPRSCPSVRECVGGF